MILDNQTLLFSLVLISAMMALSLTIVCWGKEQDSLKKWASAMALESIAWILLAARSEIDLFWSITVANMLLVSAQALKLAAIYEYRKLALQHWKYLLPLIMASVLFLIVPYDDLRSRVVYGSLIYLMQLLLIAQVLFSDKESRTGRAWLLLMGSTAFLVPLFILRAIVSFFSLAQFATPETTIAPNPVQLIIFMGLIALSVLGSMGFILMIKEKSDRLIRTLAMIDSLTGLYNRRAFMERAEKEYAIAMRNKLPLAVLMLDIDYFKRINDEYGHPTGDAVLVNVGRILNSRLRKQDTLARFGGEEFCIILPSTNIEGAKTLAENIRVAISNSVITVADNNISITISIGITVCNGSCENCTQPFNKLIDDADAALYLAKNDGRNCSVVMPVRCCEIKKATAVNAAAVIA